MHLTAHGDVVVSSSNKPKQRSNATRAVNPAGERQDWEICEVYRGQPLMQASAILQQPFGQEHVMSRKPNQHIVQPHTAGGWEVTRPGAERASGLYDTKREAE